MMTGEQFLYNRPTFPAQLNFAHPLTRGLVGCWVLNENSSNSMRAWDSSLYKNHGTVFDAKGYWQGRTFNNTSDYISFGTGDFGLEGKGAATILAWVKPTTIDNDPIFGALGGAGASEYFTFLLLTANLYLSTTTTLQATVTSNATIPLNVWSHVVGRYDGANLRLFINGAIDTVTGNQTGNLTRQNGASEFCIGQYHSGGLYFDGIVGELLIYSRALTAAEIQRIYLEPYAMFL